MDKCVIVDNRKFSRLSFSNHKKANLLQEFTECLYYKKRDDALHWTAEMICSGFFLELWKTYILYYCKFIHIYNIKIAIYLFKKLEEFKAIQSNDMKNDDQVRHIFFTITIIFCETKNENTLYSMPFVFQLDQLHENLKANHVDYIKPFFKEDPKEFYIPLNEFVYHLEITQDKSSLYYWVDWLIEYDIYLTKKKRTVSIQKRSFVEFKQENKSCNMIWILWEIILHYASKKNELTQQCIRSLMGLFQIKYSVKNNKTFKGLLYVSINLILKDANVNIRLIENTQLFKHLYDNTQIIFNVIKKKEVWVEEAKTEKQKLYESVYKI